MQRSNRTTVVFANLLVSLLILGCQSQVPPTTSTNGSTTTPTTTPATAEARDVSAADLLGAPDTVAFCYGGFRAATRERCPTVEQIKDDMRILAALGVKMIRTYNTQQFDDTARLLEAIKQLRAEDPKFEMYVMLGAWIECANAWSKSVDHEAENETGNRAEIDAAVKLAQAHPETIKIIAVGNEAMVHWAANYFVRPAVILKWVNHLQKLKKSGDLPADLWITSSDNFAAWGGGAAEYHTADLKALIEAVDYVSLHTYPFHHTHYDPDIWGAPRDQESLESEAKTTAAIERALKFGQAQYQSTKDYIASLGLQRTIHIGETGWASSDNQMYGSTGSKAADEFKAALFYAAVRKWTTEAGITCFYFEAFDEPWKDSADPRRSENHFGLLTVNGQAKYALWNQVDQGIFQGLTRDGRKIEKTYNGDRTKLMAEVSDVPLLSELDRKKLTTVNPNQKVGEPISAKVLVVLHETMDPATQPEATYPSVPVKLNVWEGTSDIVLTAENVIQVTTGTGEWWGCALEVDGGGENLSSFAQGQLHFEIKGATAAPFEVGIQSGIFGAGTQVNGGVAFNSDETRRLTDQWVPHSISLADLTKPQPGSKAVDLADVRSFLFLRGSNAPSHDRIEVRNVYFTRE